MNKILEVTANNPDLSNRREDCPNSEDQRGIIEREWIFEVTELY